MSQAIQNPNQLTPYQLLKYKTDGFLILRGVFDANEMRELLAESDRLLTERSDLINPRNLRCRYMAHHETSEQLFEVFDPVNDISPICKRFCFDSRIMNTMSTIYGEPACLFKEKLIFKPAGSLGYQLHQDIPFGWDCFPRSFVTLMIPIDASSEENGCTEVFSGYHGDFLVKDRNIYMLSDDLVDESRKTNLALNPGDVALFHGLTPHRSAPNKTGQMRRMLYVSYNAESDGGDQRESHYASFREWMGANRQSTMAEPVYYA